MGKSAELLINRLNEVFASGRMRKADFLRKTGMSPSVLEAYLQRRSVPGLEAVERIAEAIEVAPWELLNPGVEPTPLADTETLDNLAEVLNHPALRDAIRAQLKFMAESIRTGTQAKPQPPAEIDFYTALTALTRNISDQEIIKMYLELNHRGAKKEFLNILEKYIKAEQKNSAAQDPPAQSKVSRKR